MFHSEIIWKEFFQSPTCSPGWILDSYQMTIQKLFERSFSNVQYALSDIYRMTIQKLFEKSFSNVQYALLDSTEWQYKIISIVSTYFQEHLCKLGMSRTVKLFEKSFSNVQYALPDSTTSNYHYSSQSTSQRIWRMP